MPKRCGRPPKADIISIVSISANGFDICELLVKPSDNEEKYTQPPLKRKAVLPFKEPLLVSENVVYKPTPLVTVEEASLEKPKSVTQPTEKLEEASLEKSKSVTQPTEKQRGRPLKTSPLMGNPALAVQLSSTDFTRILSLKEKLAIKRKSFKIVAAKSQRSLASPANLSSARSTPSLVKVIQTGSSLSSPLAITKRSSVIQSKNFMPLPSPAPTSVKLSGNARVATAQVLSTNPAQPVKKLPTVVRLQSSEPVRKGLTIVRLDSPEEESGSEGYLSSSDESIPAVRPSLKIAKADINLADRFDTTRGVINGGLQRGREMPLREENYAIAKHI